MIIYLATPYSHPAPEARKRRFEIANDVAAWVMVQGHTCFSPISHSHPIAKYLNQELVMDHDFWMKQDLPILEKCDELWIYPGDAHQVSRGVERELKHAKETGIPVKHIWPWDVQKDGAMPPCCFGTHGFASKTMYSECNACIWEQFCIIQAGE